MSNESAAQLARRSALHVRKVVLQQSRRAGVGHIGSALSVADLLAAIYSVGRDFEPANADRDRVVLSKGHAALALYAILNFHGAISDAELNTYCTDDTLLGVHPENVLPGIDFSTGSLGQGLSMAAGAAYAGRLRRSLRRVTALISDAECNEGSIWEAAMFAGHHHLSNLVAVIDLNRQQALGFTRDISTVEDMAARWRAFGWHAIDCDGHDVAGLVRHLTEASEQDDRPTVLVAKTTFGCGVSYMEHEVKWHYLPMDEEQYSLAMQQVEALA